LEGLEALKNRVDDWSGRKMHGTGGRGSVEPLSDMEGGMHGRVERWCGASSELDRHQGCVEGGDLLRSTMTSVP
jgi:hypothetical protein